MKALLKHIEGDKVIWMVALLLSLVSILAVYSSIGSLAVKEHATTYKYLIKHSVLLAMGFGVMLAVHRIPFKYFSKISTLLIWVAGFMLLFTLLFGADVNEAKRWIKIPFINLTFQTSDFAKIVLITYVARMLNQKRTQLHDFKNGVRPILVPVLVYCGLILPADFSTAAMLGLICFVLMYLGGVPVRHLLKIMGLGLAALVLVYALGKAAPDLMPRFDTWTQRIDNFFNPEEKGNFQVNLAQYAIHDGGLLPAGPGSGNSLYLPHPYSDMIYAFIIQEYGSILGGIGLLLLYLIFLFRSVQISFKCPRHFGSMLALGMSVMLVLQALINMAVAVNLFPTTGQPLPLVSMGGTSTLFTCIAVGMILSVSRSVFNPESLEAKGNNAPKHTSSDANTTRPSDTEYEIA